MVERNVAIPIAENVGRAVAGLPKLFKQGWLDVDEQMGMLFRGRIDISSLGQ